MWTRAQLKTNAKGVLQNNYWVSFAAAVTPMIFAGILSFFMSLFFGATTYSFSTSSSGYYYSASVAPGMGFLGFLLAIALVAFVYGPLNIGVSRFFIQAAKGDCQYMYVFSGFQQNYMKNVINMFMYGLFIFLWSLLFFFPGIYKMYQYYMVPYLLAENPDMDYKQAIELSKAMTQGDKWNIFVLNLSFIGWLMLGSLACGVGQLFIYPYINGTDAQLYFALSAKIGLPDTFNASGFGDMGGQSPFGTPIYPGNQPPVYPNNQATNYPQPPVYPQTPPAPQPPVYPSTPFSSQPPITPTGNPTYPQAPNPPYPNYNNAPASTPTPTEPSSPFSTTPTEITPQNEAPQNNNDSQNPTE